MSKTVFKEKASIVVHQFGEIYHTKYNMDLGPLLYNFSLIEDGTELGGITNILENRNKIQKCQWDEIN